jgi:hypothetical protein
LALTGDDLVASRGRRQPSPRDNVLLEVGLFVGILGRERTFAVCDRAAELKLPSDLAGITLATYQCHADGNLRASLGAACTQIEAAIREQGIRGQDLANPDVNRDTQFRTICNSLDFTSLQFFILMHESVSVPRKESALEAGVPYAYHWRSKGDCGEFSFATLCLTIPDAGLLSIDLRDNLQLTALGHGFAAWLIEKGWKADQFTSGLGSWGDPMPAWWQTRIMPISPGATVVIERPIPPPAPRPLSKSILPSREVIRGPGSVPMMPPDKHTGL